jgi:hypothetical protein
MPALHVDSARRHVQVDLHGYGLAQARLVAWCKVREAWENGFRQITLIHGAAGSRRQQVAWQSGYGTMKWHLRGQFQRGKWRRFLYHGRSRKHRLGPGCMRLAVRPNPAPREAPDWTPLPPARYGVGATSLRLPGAPAQSA